MKKITINGEEITIAFNLATELAYEEIYGVPFNARAIAPDGVPNSAEIARVAVACVKTNNPGSRIDSHYIMYEATREEASTIITTVMEVMIEWLAVPAMAEQHINDSDNKKGDEEEEEMKKKKKLSAHEIYEILVGTIGHDTLLYVLRGWQIRAAIRGYYRQQRAQYESARMLGLWTVSCQRSKNSSPLELQDLCVFPWEKEFASLADPTEEEIQRLKDLMRQENEDIEKENLKP